MPSNTFIFSPSDIERAREESKRYESQERAPLFFSSITLVPIVLVVLWILVPDDSFVVYTIKAYVAGVFMGLFMCDFVAVLVSVHPQYWISFVTSIVFTALCVGDRMVTNHLLSTILQISAVLLTMLTTVAMFFFMSLRSSNYRMGFRAALMRPCLLFIALLVPMCTFLVLVDGFERYHRWSQLYFCILYQFIASIYRGFVSLFLPNKERTVFQVVSVCFGAFLYRMLFVHMDSWIVYGIALGAELIFKWVSYITYLSNAYFFVSRQVHEYFKKKYLYSRIFVVLESESEGESNEIDMGTEKLEYHKELSSNFFVQTHADIVFSVGLFAGQAAVLWFTPILALNYPTLYMNSSSLLPVALKYFCSVGIEVVNFFIFYKFLQWIGKNDFQPISEGLISIVTQHTTILFSHATLYLLIFMLFYHVA